MDTIVIEVISVIRLKLVLTEFPELSSEKKWVQRALTLLKEKTPAILNYLGRQKTMANLRFFRVVLQSKKRRKRSQMRRAFKIWLSKEKGKRLFQLIILGIILPVTPLLAILPGPNIFFYIPFLLFYFAWISYKGIRKVNVDEMEIEVISPVKS
jgi:hypothetical protein